VALAETKVHGLNLQSLGVVNVHSPTRRVFPGLQGAARALAEVEIDPLDDLVIGLPDSQVLANTFPELALQ